MQRRMTTQVAENKASVRVLEEDTKLCPGEDCGRRCFKVDECDHMTCTLYVAEVLEDRN